MNRIAQLLVVGLSATVPLGNAAESSKPNILFILADDLGYEALNCYGGLDFETPNLSRMAQQGLRFRRAYTSPVCTPSRVSLHTGLYVNRHGHVNVLPVHLGTDKAVDFQKFPTFAQRIRANGYRTSVTGKWQLATLEKHPYVFFMGDNGTWEPDFRNPKAGQPGERPHTRHTTADNVNGGKNQLNDGGSHVPLLVWGPPSVPAGVVCDDLVDVVDLLPTFCELTGTELPASVAIDGRSLIAQVHGRPGIRRAWVHHALASSLGGENLFDGRFRLFRQSGKMIDARELPSEKPADLNDPEVVAAKARLEAVFQEIQPKGPRPPTSFRADGKSLPATRAGSTGVRHWNKFTDTHPNNFAERELDANP